MLADLLMASKAYEEALQVILHRTRKSFSFVPVKPEFFQVLFQPLRLFILQRIKIMFTFIGFIPSSKYDSFHMFQLSSS